MRTNCSGLIVARLSDLGGEDVLILWILKGGGCAEGSQVQACVFLCLSMCLRALSRNSRKVKGFKFQLKIIYIYIQN